MMSVLGVIVPAYTALVAFGALTDRIKIESCYAAEPGLDLRMRITLEDRLNIPDQAIGHNTPSQRTERAGAPDLTSWSSDPADA